MRIKKRYAIIGSVTLGAVILAGLCATGALGPQPYAHGGFHPGFCGHGFAPEEVSEFILKRCDTRAEDLKLSEEQQQEYLRIRSEMKENIIEAMEKRRMFLVELRDEINRENPDMHAVAQQLKERVNNIPGFVSENVDHLLVFYDMLDESQKARVVERIRCRMD